MSPVTLLLRIIFGVILAGSIMLLVGLPFPFDLIFVLSAGILAALWGDKFLLGFMSLMRYFR
ncbi:MAG TPA: hypothetical protein VK868_10320 [Pyrinomonadaceae bacterium]|nr:hypothetical protein [Pyrinomonadaceae bacterium]